MSRKDARCKLRESPQGFPVLKQELTQFRDGYDNQHTNEELATN